ncbi:MAG TPA: 2-dehydropantoate 2-reductase [Thermodesulfobacteriota bacterium]
MKIAIMGSGGVGGYVGARLAKAGHDVRFIARGAHLRAMREEGLGVESPRGRIHLHPVEVTDDPAAVGPVDLVVFAVKLWGAEAAARQILPMLGPDTAVVTFQNGVEANDMLGAVVGRERLVGGVCYIATVIERPGVIRHTGQMARFVMGEFGGGRTKRIEAIEAAFRRADGLDFEVSADIEAAIWQKFVFLTALAALTAMTRMPIGPIREDPDARAFFLDLMREVVAVGRARGVRLDPAFADERLAFADTLPAEMKASMAHDLERGNPLEVHWLSGAVVRLGAEAGVPTPANRAAYVALKLHADGRPR